MAPSSKAERFPVRTVLSLSVILASALPALASPRLQVRREGPAAEAPALRARRLPVKDAARAVAPWRDPTRVVLKLVDDAKAHVVAGRLEAGEAGKDIIAVQGFLESFAELRVEPYVELPGAELARMKAAGEALRGEALADLSQYFLVQLGPGADTRWLVENLLQLSVVEAAYCLPRKITVAGDITPPVTGDLTYAQPQNGKYDFPWVAARPGGTGAGVTITDVEANWNLQGMFGDTITHEDLQGLDAQSPPPAAWDTSTWTVPADPNWDVHHGTAVLGMLGADVDSAGMDGLVPGATLRVSGAHTTSGWKIADAIVQATAAMGPGGIILLELQISGPNSGACSDPQNPPAWDRCCANGQFGSLPLEYLNAEFDAIKQATALGLNVVEPAGNGEQDFDDWSDGAPCVGLGDPSYTVFDPNLKDSGAILVGATDSVTTLRAWFSNHGRRVDACAQGDSLGTLAYGDLYNGNGDVDQFYTQAFGGTSGASPQVTAAAAILEAAQAAYHGSFVYAAHAMRLFLRTAGTPTTNPQLDRIGEQPELRDQHRIQSTGRQAALVFDTRSAQASNVGKWVDGIGDADGDGYGDVVVSEPGFNAGFGRVYVLSGATGEIWWQLDAGGPGNDVRVSAAGDFNQDGFDDVIISDPNNFQPGNIGGYATIHSGWDGSLLQWLGTGILNEQVGYSTDGLGDLDGVGAAEVVLGAPGWSSNRGRIYVWGSIFAPVDGEIAWPRLGHDVANAGDVDQDGIDDVVASAVQSAAGAGKVYVYSGANQSLLWSWSDSGSNGFGYSVAGAGDTDADGHGDVLVGMPSYASNRGRVVVYSGRDGGVLDVLDGFAAGDRFGWCVDGVGDVNRNSFDDYLVSAPDAVPATGQVGAVYVFDGRIGKLLRTYRGEARPGVAGDDYGFAAASAGDIDGDGLSDVIVGAPGWGGFGPPGASVDDGRVYTYLTPGRGPRYLPSAGVANGVRTAEVDVP